MHCKMMAVLLIAALTIGDARLQTSPSLQPGAKKVLAQYLLSQDPSTAFAPSGPAARPSVSSSTSVAWDSRMGLSRSRPMMTELAPSAQSQPQARNQVHANILSMLLKAKAFRNRILSNEGDAATGGIVMQETKKPPLDISLFVVTALWYLGNYYFNINNKIALNAAGGAAGFPLSIATTQLGVGALYAMFLWLAPDARKRPTITMDDYKKMLPVGFFAGAAHASTVFAMSAGAVSFAQIVKAAEPAFAALIGTVIYGATVSKAKWLALIPVIGGVSLASLGELDFAWKALFTAAAANVFASFRSNEFNKMMSNGGIMDRLGSVGNQFAVAHTNSFLCLLPLMFFMEGGKFGAFVELLKTNPVVLWNTIFSGIWFYLYNELSTMVVKKTNAVTMSVLNTAKRVIVIVCVALVMGESLGFLKLLGSAIGIAGVFLYSIIDKLVAKKEPAPAPAPAAA